MGRFDHDTVAEESKDVKIIAFSWNACACIAVCRLITYFILFGHVLISGIIL